jgi:PAS domain S-box-containing protein
MLSPDIVRHVLDSAPDAMVIVDAEGVIVFANRQVSELFGYEPGEVTGQRVEILVPEQFRDRHISHRQSYVENVRVRPMGKGLELFARRKDGTEFPVEISLSPMGGTAEVLSIAAIRDVTDRRSIELQLTEAREAAIRANQAKSRFLATASHDLRQPLQTLALLNGALRRMVHDSDSADALAQAEQAIGTMSRLLNALLDISKLESGAIKPEVTDFVVAEIFDELRAEFATVAAQKGLRLQVEPSTVCVRSDPSLIEQALRNLISNAIKYTRRGGVQLRCLQDQGLARVEVLDTGIGIAADALGHIYEDFYQVGIATNASRDGYGLGLSIVHRIMGLLGHKLEVRSEVGKGSAFCLTIPLGNRAHLNPDGFSPSRAVASQQGRTPPILLVEDDPGVRKATRLLLNIEGYDVATAGSLREALEQAARHPDIGLLVTDYHLTTSETGVDVISALRQRLAPGLRCILVTGDTSSAVQELQHDERLRFTSKPIRADEFLSVVRELLSV